MPIALKAEQHVTTYSTSGKSKELDSIYPPLPRKVLDAPMRRRYRIHLSDLPLHIVQLRTPLTGMQLCQHREPRRRGRLRSTLSRK